MHGVSSFDSVVVIRARPLFVSRAELANKRPPPDRAKDEEDKSETSRAANAYTKATNRAVFTQSTDDSTAEEDAVGESGSEHHREPKLKSVSHVNLHRVVDVAHWLSYSVKEVGVIDVVRHAATTSLLKSWVVIVLGSESVDTASDAESQVD